MSDTGGTNMTQWLSLILAGLSGAVLSAVGLVKLAFTFNNRLLAIENRDIRAIVVEELARERHDVLYPMLQVRVFDSMDKIEEELKKQGQNIAILLERDRTATALENIANSINRASDRQQHDKS